MTRAFHVRVRTYPRIPACGLNKRGSTSLITRVLEFFVSLGCLKESGTESCRRGEERVEVPMRTVTLGICVSPSSIDATSKACCSSILNFNQTTLFPPKLPRSTSCVSLPKSGRCETSQAYDLCTAETPEVFVREARLEDSWEVAETHCSSFFPQYSFPLDSMLRINRLVGMLFGYSVPDGCKRTCLVAVIGSSIDQTYLSGNGSFKNGRFDGRFCLNEGYVAGILNLDTIAEFLPRKGPLQQRRTGIAYISNVAVRERFRRKGIAKRLIAKAEAEAEKWGCRAIALHCDLNNPGASQLYLGEGYKCIKIPDGGQWPQPKASPKVKFCFMMKILNSRE